jgi:hypothetical protein
MISGAVTWVRDNILDLQDFDDEYGVTWTSGVDAGLGTDKFGASSVSRLFKLDKEFNIVHIHRLSSSDYSHSRNKRRIECWLGVWPFG